MTLTIPAAQVRPGDIFLRPSPSSLRRSHGQTIIPTYRTAPVSTVGVSDGAVVTIRCGDGLLMALADTPVTVLRENGRCRCCGDGPPAEGRTLCAACCDHGCHPSERCRVPMGAQA